MGILQIVEIQYEKAIIPLNYSSIYKQKMHCNHRFDRYYKLANAHCVYNIFKTMSNS